MPEMKTIDLNLVKTYSNTCAKKYIIETWKIIIKKLE
jgi:hypothetical protein